MNFGQHCSAWCSLVIALDTAEWRARKARINIHSLPLVHMLLYEPLLWLWKPTFLLESLVFHTPFFLQRVHKRHGIFSETNNWRWNLLFDKSKLFKTLYEKKLHEQQFVLVDFSFLLFEQLWKKHRCDAVKFLNKPLMFLRRWLSPNSERYDALKVRCSPLSLPL